MVKNFNKSSYLVYSIITIVLSVFFTAGIIWAWTEPISAPPGGNVPAPLNTGVDGQAKAGGLLLATGSGITNGLIVQNGNVGIGTVSPDNKLEVNGSIEIQVDDADNKLRFHDPGNYWYSMGIDRSDSGKFKINYGENVGDNAHFIMMSSGNVGIGVTDPGYTLTVGGDLDMRDNKIRNVREIDPVFGIQGKKYVSYLPDMIHQKIEVVGQAVLDGNELVIDFELEEEGSDLWLFWQASARKTIIPFISPQSDAELYAYMEGSQFIIKLRSGEQNAKFSYRLIGTRLDHAHNTDNLYDDQNVEYFIDIDSLRK